MSPTPRGPYRFDRARADHVCEFFERYVVHTKDRWSGQPFELLPWQREALRHIFGWVHAESGRRVVRTAYLEVPKKNGKSELAAGVGLYLLTSDGVVAPEVASAAADVVQASIIHKVAKDMVLLSPALAERCVPYARSIEFPEMRGSYQVLSSVVRTKHGPSWNGLTIDEIHTLPDREMYDTLTAGMGAREEPITFGTTTSGFDRTSLCWDLHEYARQILDGLIVDPTFFALICGAPEDADWTKESTWYGANPSLGITIDIEFLRTEFRQAAVTPTKQNAFRRLFLNQWTSQDVRWIDMQKWDSPGNLRIRKPAVLEGEECHGGLEVPSAVGLSSFVLVFPDEKGEPDVVPFFFIPADNIAELSSRDGVPYETWVDAGLIEATPGDVIDLDYMELRIRALADKYRIRSVGYDRRQALQLVTHLDGVVDWFAVPQGFGLNAPMRELERLYIPGGLRHGGNPVLRWMADNVYAEENANKELRISRKKSLKPVTGIRALVHALDRMSRVDEDEYRGTGISFVGGSAG